MKITRSKKGATIIELLLVLAVLSILSGFVVINLGRITRTTSVLSSSEVLLSDVRTQQEKAMNGAGDGTENTSFGIFFETDKYTLFRGTAYSASEPTNIVINLPEDINFVNITFPQSTVVFNATSGEISGFSAGNNTVSLVNTTGGEQKAIRFNRYGVIDSIN
jgi:prepilin-type N-terminal cleavage/methylation domain-containing protein